MSNTNTNAAKTVVKTGKSNTGYVLVVTDAQGKTSTTPIQEFAPKDTGILHLPANPANRQWLTVAKITAAGGTLELAYKPTRTITHTGTHPRKTWESYMTEAEKKQVLAIKQACEERKAKDKPSKRELLEQKIAKLQAELNACK